MSAIPKAQRYTIRDLRLEFPDDDACLDWLRDRLYPAGIHCPKCDRVTKHHRVASRKSYSCQFCGHHVHPTAGTIFHKSSTPLTLWFHAIYVMSQTRCGISAKQLQRELGVTYKTAWRMFNQIRKLLSEGDDGPTLGSNAPVEMDETYVGGRGRTGNRGRSTRGGNKTPVFGMVERGGQVVARSMPGLNKEAVLETVRARTLPASMIYTDEYSVYRSLGKEGYRHSRIKHGARIYVDGDVHTNTIEGFFSLAKNGIRGVYHSVSEKHLQGYLDEYSFRYNHREDMTPMFKIVLGQIRRLDGASPA
jgi:transposase-like protein